MQAPKRKRNLKIPRLVRRRCIWYNISAMSKNIFEIERKFLIRRPDRDWLCRHASASQITQTYLKIVPGESARVRKRVYGDHISYTHTMKQKISDMRRVEREIEISQEEYEKLLKQAHPARRTIEKERWVLNYHNQAFEIDLFPFWEKQAYLELELESEEQEIDFPPDIEILREVTADKRYTNAALAKEIPDEDEKE